MVPRRGVVAQLRAASSGFANEEISIFLLIAVIAIPGFVIKNIINVIQLYQSMIGLCHHDLKNM